MDVPTTIDEIDPVFLSAVFGVDVSSVTATRIAAGAGFLGELARIELSYSGEAGPATVIAKIPTSDAGMKPIGLMLDVYQREHRAYAEAIPQLEIRTPAAYYNGRDGDDYCLILEDVAHLRAGDQHAGAGIADGRAAMTAAAGLHARWWGRVDTLEWVPPIDSPLNLGLQALLEESLPRIADQLGDQIGSDLLGRIEEFIPTCRDMLVAYGEVSHTLIHGDFRLDNMFFAADDELLLLDWQLVGRGDGFADITPFLAGNLDSDLRREHELHLLRLYHDTINDLGAGHVHFDDVVTNYRFSLNFWFAMYCYSAVTADPANERGVELWERVVSRLADAVRQHEPWELIGDHSRRPETLG